MTRREKGEKLYKLMVDKDVPGIQMLNKAKAVDELGAFVEQLEQSGDAVLDVDDDGRIDAIIMQGRMYLAEQFRPEEARANGHNGAHRRRGPLNEAERADLEQVVRRSAPGLGLGAYGPEAAAAVVGELADHEVRTTDDHFGFYLNKAALEVKAELGRERIAEILAGADIRLPQAPEARREVLDRVRKVVESRHVDVDDPQFSCTVLDGYRSANTLGDYRAQVALALGAGTPEAVVDAVARELRDRGIDSDDPNFRSYAYSARLGAPGASGRAVHDVLAVAETGGRSFRFGDIELPPLDVAGDMGLYPENIRHLGLAYFVMQFEELKVFQAVDKLAHRFLRGKPHIPFGAGGQRVYQFAKRRDRRFSQLERLSFYRQVFGLGTAPLPSDVQPNARFPHLWMNLLVAVTEYISTQRVGELILSGRGRQIGNRERILRAARDLQTNVSQAGFGGVPWIAREIGAALQDAFDVLSDREVLAATGEPDAWSLLHAISAEYLGGAGDVYQKKTMAQEGRFIFDWLADHHRDVYVVGDTELEKLVTAVEKWLSVNLAQEEPRTYPTWGDDRAIAAAPRPAAAPAAPAPSPTAQPRFS